MSIIDTTAQATGVGGALNLGGNYRASGDAQAFARIESVKENATDANYAYGMAFSTTPDGGTFTEAVRIDSAGRVGIGTTAPSVRTHVSGASTASALRLDETTSSANSYLGYIDTSGNFGIDVNGGGYLRFGLAGKEAARWSQFAGSGTLEIKSNASCNLIKMGPG